jgi:hypothetical protein
MRTALRRGVAKRRSTRRLRHITGECSSAPGTARLFEFRSFVEAVRCAVAVQNSIAECFSAAPPERRIVFRIGIYVGDVVEKSDGDLTGDGVNFAARLERIAQPGGTEGALSAKNQRRRTGFLGDATGGNLGEMDAELERTQLAIEVTANASGRTSLTGMITSAGIFRRRAATRIASSLGAS